MLSSRFLRQEPCGGSSLVLSFFLGICFCFKGVGFYRSSLGHRGSHSIHRTPFRVSLMVGHSQSFKCSQRYFQIYVAKQEWAEHSRSSIVLITNCITSNYAYVTRYLLAIITV
jgi:hypothetical protein